MTSGIVVDASVVVDLVLACDQAAVIAERIRGHVLHAPHLIDIEVANGIRRSWLSGLIYGSRLDAALAAALDLPINRYSHRPLLPRILALRENVTAYDGSYVAHAEILYLPLITRDGRLARSSGHTARIEFIE